MTSSLFRQTRRYGVKRLPKLRIASRSCVVIGASVAMASSFAGRPLTVDDAGTNDKGEGHVEVWAAHADGATVLNVSPAYAVAEGLEIAALLSRAFTNKVTGSAAQVKWIIKPIDEGCGFGAAFGGARAGGDGVSANAAFLNGIATCGVGAIGNLHLNLGASKTSGAATIGTWGVALEREFGKLTPHIEWFGAEGDKPNLQLGLRGDASKSVQLDGTAGRVDGNSLYSLGMKFRF